MLQCNELDLYNCPNIKDFSAVSHIPMVRKRCKKISSSQEKMLTREQKRLRENLQISTTSLYFEPILESIAQFLEFPDVAHVSQLNKIYQSTTWKYVLSSSHRSIHCNPLIDISKESLAWIIKYTNLLKYQELKLYRLHESDLDLSMIPQLDTLSLFYGESITMLPLRVNCLSCYRMDGNIPDLIGTTSVLLFDSTITTYSETVHTMLFHNHDIDCNKLPHFPNLQSLEMSCRYVMNAENILKMYPNLKTLKITCNNINFIHEIQSYQHTLVIISDTLVNITSFSMLQCHELNLIGCPSIQDYSAVSHIPIVRK